MTVTVTMLDTRMGEDGALWATGTSHDATETFAKGLVHHGWATARFPNATGATTARARVTAGGEFQLLDQNGDIAVVGGGTAPQRVFVIGDSITARQFRVLSNVAFVSVSGTDVVTTWNTNTPAPGSIVRVYKQADAALNIEVPVVAVTGVEVTLRYPFPVDGRTDADINAMAYGLSADSGWPNYAFAQLAAAGKPVTLVGNFADGGGYTSEMVAKVPTDIAPMVVSGDIVAVMVGINDIERITTAQLIADLAALFDALLALGVTVHASTIGQPGNTSYYVDSAAAIAQQKAANGYIRARCAAEARMKCFDTYAAFGGSDAATGGLTEAAGVHPLPAGAAAIGARYVADCGADYRKGSYRRWMSTQDNWVDATSWNLLTNCEFAGATGATPPTDWTATGSANTFTVAARADHIGNDLTIAKAHSAANATTLSQDITARVSVGDRLILGTEFETTTVGESHYFAMFLELTVSGQTVRHGFGVQQTTYANGGRMPPTGTRWVFERDSDTGCCRDGCVIPVGTTAVLVKYIVQQGANGTLECKISRPHCYKVTA